MSTSRPARTAAALCLGLLAAVTTGGSSPAAAAASLGTVVLTTDRDGDSEVVLRLADGSVRPLTRNTAADYDAVWSPDGRRLAFVSDRDGDDEVFVMAADGSGLRQLTRNGRTASGVPAQDQAPSWSPDGRLLAFASTRDGGEAEVYVMRADGTGQRRVTRTARTVVDHTPSFSPSGTHLVFSTTRHGSGNTEVYRVRLDGSGLLRLTRTADGVDDNAPRWSPDGRSIAFSSTRAGAGHDVFVMAPDGRGPRRLAGAAGLDDVFPRWTPDGRHLLWSTFATDRLSADLWIGARDGTGVRRLTAGPADESFGDVRPPVR